MRLREKTKRSLSLLMAMIMLCSVVLTGTGITVKAEEKKEESGAVFVQLKRAQEESLAAGEKHVVTVSAQSSLSTDATLNLYLKNNNDTAALDIAVPNLYSAAEEITDAQTRKTLEETLAQAVCYADGTTGPLKAEWMQDTDAQGNVTARYLQAAVPAGAAVNFDMEVQYDLAADVSGIYEKVVKVEAAAQMGDVDVTETAETDADKVKVIWAGEKAADAVLAVETDEVSDVASTYGTSDVTYTSAQIKAIMEFLDEHPNYALLDTTGMTLGGADWTTAGTLYCWDTTNTGVGWVSSLNTSNITGWPSELSGTNIRCWDLSNSGIADSDTLLFLYKNDWTSANGNDYYKTTTYSASDLKGSLRRYVGTYVSTSGDDTGRTYYTLEKIVYERSPLSGRTIYLDTTNISGMTGTPKVKIVEEDGTTTLVAMSTCYNQENVYQYTFDNFVLTGTSFYFVNADASVTVPATAVSSVDSAKPCFNGTEWVAYVPESSTVQIYVDHPFTNKGGATVVFTKNGTETGSTYDMGTEDGFFYFDFSDTSYDGFYIKQKEDSQTGNKTEVVSANDVREAVSTYGSPITLTVGGWVNTNTRRTVTFEKYASVADRSLDIPSGTFTRNSELYYVHSTFYDYYSDTELGGSNRNTLSGNFNHNPGSSDKLQATIFNGAISDYFAGTSLAQNGSSNTASKTFQSPLYFGEFTRASTAGLTNFVWLNNNGEPNRVNGASGARQGLVNSSLVDDQLVMGTENLAAPYFNESFLRGNNSKGKELGYVFPDVEFPFVKNEDGYWEFDSYDSSQSLRMKNDNGTYFLDRVGSSNAVHGMTMYGNAAVSTANSNFFPFNDVAESCASNVNNAKRLNYAFGLRLDIPFYMTADGKVTVTDKNGNSSSKDIVFDFSGDDDVWIFIDGKLVLDIGGDHGAVTGQINFASGTATTTTNSSGGSSVSFSEVFDSSKLSNGRLLDTEEHTLTMFYMERGLWESNMKVTFNFPQSNKLEVEKEVVIPDGVNSYFAETMEVLQTSTTFPVSISNLVTSGQTVTVTGTVPAVDEAYDVIDGNSKVTLDTPKNSSVCKVGSGGGRQTVLDYYYPNEKGANDPQSVTDARSFYIEKNVNLSGDQVKKYGYLQFDAYVNDSSSPSSPFVALIDKNGNKIGAWTSGAVYGGGSNSMLANQWKTIKVDLSKLNAIVGSKSDFDYEEVVKIQIAYWNDVHIYFDDFRIKAPAQYAASTGFTKDQGEIPDYGSFKSNDLEPIEGAEYTLTGTTGTLRVVGSDIYLRNKDSAVFSDQFRRESYLSIIEDCDPDVFDIKWSISENETVQKSGKGATVDDGRTEPSPEITSRTTKPESGSVLFKSYDESAAESVTRFFEIQVKYTNTLKTGNLTIAKALKEGQTDNNDDYTFVITFSNVAGMSLEEQISTPLEPMTVTVKAGQSTTISGIPAGTSYTIQEVPQAGQEFTLVSVNRTGNDSYSANISGSSVSGTVSEDTSGADIYTFTNDVNPSVKIEGTKTWEDVPENETPATITVTLQRKLTGEEDEKYEPAKDMDGELVGELEVSNDTDWTYVFNNVPKYNGTGDGKVEYVYRVVETKIGDADAAGNDIFEVTGGEKNEDGKYDITNKYIPKTSIEITKVDAADTTKKLAGVEFQLQKKNSDDSLTDIATVTTGDGENDTTLGVAVFSDLLEGTYILTETKTAAGYNLLKDPITIVIDRSGNGTCTIDGTPYTVENNVIKLTISNRAQFTLPSTGGYGREIMILGGLALIWAVLFKYRLQVCRKGGRSSRKRM